MRTQVQKKGLWSRAKAGLVWKHVAFAGSPWHSGLYPGERCRSYNRVLRAVTTKPGVGAEPQLHTPPGDLQVPPYPGQGEQWEGQNQVRLFLPPLGIDPTSPLGFLNKGGYFGHF